ncbi:hypothetical protein CPC735_045130 [Coccidioides posadasii C735 delta SOWgp]|uniref:Uncharacterized protein n=1 Tax=Coccidioides posadasii (strain C735) TaxID=222929 RepID=C5PES5_COCP7|nr:hypothetical protein CPC735_045130 [Coccidioides posadasii C735 delta SOWgp]EER23143.1 hypothetical protein CPC735_045130 [Coccidioides posadasii C735 delta SOWgp]|eukprot:XP_003065288.1 hypothetical protein CPC735_045130 [Coccidioides posadasii C735 delta SOWgp]
MVWRKTFLGEGTLGQAQLRFLEAYWGKNTRVVLRTVTSRHVHTCIHLIIRLIAVCIMRLRQSASEETLLGIQLLHIAPHSASVRVGVNNSSDGMAKKKQCGNFNEARISAEAAMLLKKKKEKAQTEGFFADLSLNLFAEY